MNDRISAVLQERIYWNYAWDVDGLTRGLNDGWSSIKQTVIHQTTALWRLRLGT